MAYKFDLKGYTIKLTDMPQVKSKKSEGSRKGTSALKKSTAVKASPKRKPATPAGPSSDRNPLQKFFVDSLKDIYWAEKHLTKAIPKLSKAATNSQLKDALNEHLSVTQEQITRIEQVFEILGLKAQAKKCEAMEGLTKEANSIVEETEKGSNTRDVGIIMAAQKVEHYEIATYGGLVHLARTLGMDEIADLLGQTLAEEKDTDENLTMIAENNINLQAEKESEDETED